MKNISMIVGFVFTMMILFSCKNNKEEAKSENSEITNDEISRDMLNEISTNDRDSIIKKLQGKWKEIEYPFRVAEFNNSTVKFIEEGLVENPRFLEYKISKTCLFDVNNLQNAKANDIFLVMDNTQTCEILNVLSDTLVLSGYNVTTGSNYKKIYKKVD